MNRRTFLLPALLVAVHLATPGTAAAALRAAPASPPSTDTVLPAPTGPLRVGTTTEHLVDARRADPWAPDVRARELMIQTWYPARPGPRRPTEPYSSPAAAQALEAALGARPGSLSAVTTHARSAAAPLPAVGGRPLLLFSHGRSGNRTNMTAVAEDLASHGFVVVGVDHTYDSLAVQFPDGRVAAANRPAVPDDPTLAAEVGVRAADLRFVLDEVLAGRAARPVGGLLDRRRIGTFGHSLGGATAAELLRTDRRVRAGVDLDGGLSTEGTTLAVDRPFLLLTRPDEHESWVRWRAEQQRWGRHLVVAGTGHFSFTDLDVLAGPAGVREALPPEADAVYFGTIAAGRTTTLARSHVLAFFRLHLQGRPTRVFDRPCDPEVSVRTGG